VCTVPLPPGVNPIAVDKIYLSFTSTNKTIKERDIIKKNLRKNRA
jgi:hypothetical protein